MACLLSGNSVCILLMMFIISGFPDKYDVRIKRYNQDASGVFIRRNRLRKIVYAPDNSFHYFMRWI